MFLLLIKPVFKWVYLSSNIEKSDTFLHCILPRPFDPYVNEPEIYLKIQYSWNNSNLECFYLIIQMRLSDMDDIF